MKQSKLFWIFGIFFALIALIAWIGIFSPVNGTSAKSVTFVVAKGEGSREIAYHLEQSGLIRSAPLFRIWVATLGLSQKLQAGSYALSSSMSASKIGQKLASGDIIKEFITIPEGWNIADIAVMLQNQGRFESRDFLKIAKEDFAKQFDFLKDKPSSASLEGYLFPDTYQIARVDALPDVVERMLKNFGRHFTRDLQNEALRQKKTIFQIVTMASVLEKEVQTLQDKKLVAGLLWKRIAAGIPMQVDAAPETYKHKGLPVAPIANPGLESIEAALYPTPSPYWYYLSKKDGKTIYSKILEDHNAARAKYLK